MEDSITKSRLMRKQVTTAFWRGRLPHWEVEGGRYFVTIHTAGAIPDEGKRRIRAISSTMQTLSSPSHPKWLERSRSIFREMEQWLDRAERAAFFRDVEIATLVVDAIEHRTRDGAWQMLEYVVMPNHVHLFLETPIESLKSVLINFKRWTGRNAAKQLDLKARAFWQREWFDHWSRRDEEDDRIAAYIRCNPVAAGLVEDYRQWPFGSW